MRVYEVTVRGYGAQRYNATSASKARYSAYLSDVFCDMPFRDFLKIASVRSAGAVPDGYTRLREYYRDCVIPSPGTRIIAEGLKGTVLPALRSTNYVVFQPDGQDREAFVHPKSVQLLVSA